MVLKSMSAITNSKDWWTDKLKYRPFPEENYPWWVFIESETYPKMGLRVVKAAEIISQWCEKNCQHDYTIGATYLVQFEHEDDAILFRLAFSK